MGTSSDVLVHVYLEGVGVEGDLICTVYHFRGVKTPTMIKFKLPTWQHQTLSCEEMLINKCQLAPLHPGGICDRGKPSGCVHPWPFPLPHIRMGNLAFLKSTR